MEEVHYVPQAASIAAGMLGLKPFEARRYIRVDEPADRARAFWVICEKCSQRKDVPKPPQDGKVRVLMERYDTHGSGGQITSYWVGQCKHCLTLFWAGPGY